jgi:beta-phosphoglucomutase
MIKAVLFDFDGVVVDSEPVHYKTFVEFIKPLGIKVNSDRWYREFAGTGSKNIFTVLLGEAGIKDEKTIDDYVERRKKVYGKLVRKGVVKKKAGIENFLKKLKERKIKTAVVSGGHPENIETALKFLGLKRYFDAVIGSGDYKRRKPYPDAFVTGAKKLRVKSSECIAIEDSLSGFKSAKKAKMKTILMYSPAIKYIKTKEKVIRNYREFPMKLLRD